jgi:hypothetical protein
MHSPPNISSRLTIENMRPMQKNPMRLPQPLDACTRLVCERSIQIRSTLLMFVTFIWLSGCLLGCVLEPTKIDRTPPPESAIIAPPTTPLASDALPGFLLQAKKLAPTELMLKKEKARADFNAEKSELNRIKLALLLVLPAPSNTPAATLAADDAELALLIEPIASGATANTSAGGAIEAHSSESQMRVLGLLIQGSLQERKRLRDQAREAQSRTQVARTELTASQQEARILRTKLEELETQLAALKSIERSVTSRTKGRGDPPVKAGAPK